MAKLKEQTTREEFQISLQNRFSALTILDNADQDINSIWEKQRQPLLKNAKRLLAMYNTSGKMDVR